MGNNTWEKVVRTVYDRMGFVVDDELLAILTSDSQHKLIRAPAGGTKTTLSQIYLVLAKLKKVVEATKINRITPYSESTSYNMENLYCSVYNAHNVRDLTIVHQKIYNYFVGLGLISNDPRSERYATDSILAQTLHSFAYSVVDEHKRELGLRTVKKASEFLVNKLLGGAIQHITGHTPRDVRKYKELYDLYTNLMLYDALTVNDMEFQLAAANAEIDTNKLIDIFKLFDQQKKRVKMYEYADWLKLTNELLCNPQIAGRYHDKFKIMIADEIQDFTKLMFSVYSKLISNKTKTLAIGDSDQTIYQFNGASPDNIDKYRELVGVDVDIYDLSINRRCRENTFHYARNIIDSIGRRPPRKIVTQRKGGRFEIMTYESFDDEVDKIVDVINKVHYPTTAVLFRKRLDSLVLSRRLYENKTPVSYINATPFNRHGLYLTFVDTITTLFTQRTRDTWRHLFKILPFSRDKLKEFFQFDAHDMPTTMEEVQDWCYIDFSPLIRSAKLKDSVWWQVTFLQGIASRIYQLATEEYIDLVFEMFWLNYYQFLVSDDKDIFLKDVIGWVISDHRSASTLSKVLKNREETERSLISFDKTLPLTICTIHATKGLEFDRVIIAHMEEELTRSNLTSPEVAEYNNDTDTRLYYVGATRQRDCLILSYNANKPHRLNDPSFTAAPEEFAVEEKFEPLTASQASHLFTTTNPFGNIPMKRRFSLKQEGDSDAS